MLFNLLSEKDVCSRPVFKRASCWRRSKRPDWFSSGRTAGRCWMIRRRVCFHTALFRHTFRSTARTARSVCTANVPFLSYCSAYWLNGVGARDKRQRVLPANGETQPGFLFVKCQVDLSDWRQVDANRCHFDCCFPERLCFFLFLFISSSFHAGLRPGDLTEPDWQHSHCAAEARPEQRSTCKVGFCDREDLKVFFRPEGASVEAEKKQTPKSKSWSLSIPDCEGMLPGNSAPCCMCLIFRALFVCWFWSCVEEAEEPLKMRSQNRLQPWLASGFLFLRVFSCARLPTTSTSSFWETKELFFFRLD